MVEFPPLFPSNIWCSAMLKSLANGCTVKESISATNSCIGTARDFARFVILDPWSNPALLSCAVEGGSRQLRSYNSFLQPIILSDHGNWRKAHIGALETALGRKPFFPYLCDHIKMIYDNDTLKTLEEFNSAIFRFLFSFLMMNVCKENLPSYYSHDTARKRGEELAMKLHPDVSCIDTLANHGPESLPGLLYFDS